MCGLTYCYCLHANEYIDRLGYYSFPVNLDRCMGICNILNYVSNKVSIPNKTEHLNLGFLIWYQE